MLVVYADMKCLRLGIKSSEKEIQVENCNLTLGWIQMLLDFMFLCWRC